MALPLHAEAKEGESRVVVTLTDTCEASTLVLGEEITVKEGLDRPRVVITMESAVFAEAS